MSSSAVSYPAANEPLLIPVREADEPIQAPKQVSLLNGQIILNPGVSIVNFISFLLFFTLAGIFLIPVGLLTMPLLGVVYSLDPDARANASSLAQLCQLVQKFLTAPILGYICDKYGRKPLLLLGTFLSILSVAGLPNLPNIYPCYILIGMLMEIGLAAMLMAPLLADYIDDRTKGRVAGISGVMLYSASFGVTYLLENADLKNGLPIKFYELSAVGVVMLALAVFGLKGGRYHLKQAKKETPSAADALKIENHVMSQGITQTCSDDALRFDNGSNIGGSLRINGSVANQFDPRASREGEQLGNVLPSSPPPAEEKLSLIVGFKQMKNPWIVIGYVCNFLGLSCIGLLNTLLTNYVILETGDKTSNQGIVLANKHLLSAIFSALFCGYFVDKFNKLAMLVVIIFISIGSVLMLLLSPTVFHWMAYASMVCFGLATGGYMTLMSQILSKYPDPRFRASVSAVGGMFAMLGMSSISILGLYLMKHNPPMPFYMYLGYTGVGLGLLTVIYVLKRKEINKTA